MTVKQLIAQLSKLPQDLDVCVWDHEEDDYMPVVSAFYEDGVSTINLLPFDPEEVPE